MNLKDWNEATAYAETVCGKLPRDVRPKVYQMYDGRKGIELQVFDRNGYYYTGVCTGLHSTLESMKSAIDRCAQRLREG